MRDGIDETRGNDETFRVDGPLAPEFAPRDRGDAAPANTQVANRVELGLRVDNPAIQDDEIVVGERAPAAEAQGPDRQRPLAQELTAGPSRCHPRYQPARGPTPCTSICIE